MKKIVTLFISFFLLNSCIEEKKTPVKSTKIPFVWNAATVYFLLTDRFYNGDKTNDVNYNRIKKAGKKRGFEGGDIKGITQKIKEGYFTKLGVNVIWLSPVFEQIHEGTDEGTGYTYAYHGYWTKDWTALDKNFGTKEDLKELIEIAHKKGIRILLDAVINHTGPVTTTDTIWPKDWVRTQPQCNYQNYKSTVTCTLVKNLPDILTESNKEVDVPLQLIEKWKKEGRFEQEMTELDVFFKTYNYPRLPRFYIMKWLADYIKDFGIDGYRVDTVKHVEESVWQEFNTICNTAFSDWKKSNPSGLSDSFYLVGEVYGYGISAGKTYNFSDKKVNYFDKSFNSLINFEFKWNAKQLKSYEALFANYSQKLQSDLKGYGVLNYLTSHDDGQPFDVKREHSFEGATKLLLSPGTAQIYYGDETNRPLQIEGAIGDANLRSSMNWNDLATDDTQKILSHYQKLGKFRQKHPAIGAGIHQMISEKPYLFSRTFKKGDYKDEVIVGLGLASEKKVINVAPIFKDGTELHEAYSNKTVIVKNGKVIINSRFNIVLLEKK